MSVEGRKRGRRIAIMMVACITIFGVAGAISVANTTKVTSFLPQTTFDVYCGSDLLVIGNTSLPDETPINVTFEKVGEPSTLNSSVVKVKNGHFVTFFETKCNQIGQYHIKADDFKGNSDIATVNIVMDGYHFLIENLTVYPKMAKVGENITVGAALYLYEGHYHEEEIELLIDGNKIDSKTVNLSGIIRSQYEFKCDLVIAREDLYVVTVHFKGDGARQRSSFLVVNANNTTAFLYSEPVAYHSCTLNTTWVEYKQIPIATTTPHVSPPSENATPPVLSQTQKSTPKPAGFEMSLAILGLIVIAYFIMRK